MNIFENGDDIVINFDEELKNFTPSKEIEEAEDAINERDLTDVSDFIKEAFKQQNEGKRK